MKRDTGGERGGGVSSRPGRDRTRVLWLSKGLALGGQERLLELIARQHDASRFDIECAYVVPDFAQLVIPLEAAGVACRCLSTAGSRWSWVWAMWRLLGEDRFDVVHAHSPLVAAFARPMVWIRRRGRARRPLMVTTSHLEWWGYHPLTRWANRLTSPLDDVSIAVSPAVRRSMRGRAATRAVVTVQGIDVADLQRRFGPADDPTEPGAGPGGADFVVCTVANLSPQKDYDTLLRAARLVIDHRPHTRFVAVGGAYDPAYAAQVYELCHCLGLDGRFEFTGARDDAVGLMATSGAVVVASAFEAGPLIAMEAAAMARPVVSTDVGIMTDLFTHGKDCLRVPVGDPAALADALVKVIDDPVLRAELGQNARRLAEERFDISRVVIELEEIYSSGAPHRLLR
jgi:L-malate glycosyltransferase